MRFPLFSWVLSAAAIVGCGGSDGPQADSFPCAEQGIRDAVVAGGGPHFFACDGPTTVVLEATILIDRDVILDGEGALILDGTDVEPMLQVTAESKAELRRFGLTEAAITYPERILLNAGALTVTRSALSILGIDNQGTLTISESTWTPRVEWDTAGSYISNFGAVTVMSCAFSGTHIANFGVATVTDSTFSGASTSSDDAALVGIFNREGGTVTLTGSIVSGSEVNAIENLGTMMVTRSTISGNGRFAGFGGGIDNLGGTLSLMNSTVSGNTGLSAGGIYNRAALQIANSTLAENIATGDGSGIRNAGGTITLVGTLIDGDCPQDTVGITSAGYNIESPGNTCGFDQASDRVDVGTDALKLDPLTDNGGTTPTHALRPGSVAIDAIPAVECLDAEGAPLIEDQRGQSRPSGGGGMCDVGAFEVQPTE
jgi:hypothetical protein